MNIKEIVWGDDSAEKDPNILDYFVSSDHFERIKNKTKNIVVGRKGAGKSALRKKLFKEFARHENTYVINVSPTYNSIKSILNNKDIQGSFGEEIFFQHTWLRHIYIDTLCYIGHAAKGKYSEGSLAYAREVSQQLNRTSKDLVENIAEVLTKLKLKAGNLGELGLQIEKELRNIADLDALEHHVSELAESGAKFVILIDDLDLGWDNSQPANNMLLGLLSAINAMTSKVKNIYPCIFLREDVYSILITQTQHSDKYRNIERIRWSKDALLNILNERIKYNRNKAGLPKIADVFTTVFPVSVGTSNTENWLIEKTLSRPRELIQLARYYSEAVDGTAPNDSVLKESEATYSSWKLDDLCAEYTNQYPGLISIFSAWKTNFFRHKYHLAFAEVEEMMLTLMTDVNLNENWWNELVNKVDVRGLLKILYEVGFIGDFVKGGEGGSKTFYSYEERHEPRFEEIQIHPCFRRSVSTVERIRNKVVPAA